MHQAENRNDIALKKKASRYPNCVTDVPPRNDPSVSVVHCVNCVSELAECNSCFVAMVGKIDARPPEKNGEANISAPLNTYNNQVRPAEFPG